MLKKTPSYKKSVLNQVWLMTASRLTLSPWTQFNATTRKLQRLSPLYLHSADNWWASWVSFLCLPPPVLAPLSSLWATQRFTHQSHGGGVLWNSGKRTRITCFRSLSCIPIQLFPIVSIFNWVYRNTHLSYIIFREQKCAINVQNRDIEALNNNNNARKLWLTVSLSAHLDSPSTCWRLVHILTWF